MVLQFVASFDTSMWYPVPYAASQFSTTWLIVAGPPRSTYIHCGSLNWLLHRVVVRPSSAAPGALPPSYEDAATGRNPEMSVPLPGGGELGGLVGAAPET